VVKSEEELDDDLKCDIGEFLNGKLKEIDIYYNDGCTWEYDFVQYLLLPLQSRMKMARWEGEGHKQINGSRQYVVVFGSRFNDASEKEFFLTTLAPPAIAFILGDERIDFAAARVIS